MTKPVPELRFGFRRFETLEPCPPPPGYAMRSFRPGDEDDWLGLLQSDPDWQWDRARLGRLLAGEQGPIPEDGIIFATCDDKPVSTACITLQQEHGATIPSFGWVVTHPQHRRHGLATAVCRAALLRIRELGYDYTYLTTEPYRTTAIRLYLKLGFELEPTGAGKLESTAKQSDLGR